jgi:hypothetical protein
MQQDKNDIENKLRQLDNQQLPDLSHMDEHWQHMNVMLTQTTYTPPKKRYWKKITRRTITYMALAAVVITTSYYAFKTAGNNNRIKKNIPVFTVKKTDAPQQAKITAQTITVQKTKPVLPKNQILVTKLREKSDTVFLKPEATSVKQVIPSVKNLYSSLKQPSQQFEINPATDTILTGKQGTILKIQANSFVYAGFKIVSKPVRITLIECYEYADILAHQLTTASNDMQLITGGMINLKAEDSDKKTIKLLWNRPVQVSMPAKKFDPDMQLFVNDTRQERLTEQSDSLSDVAGDIVTNWRPAAQPQGYINTGRFVHPKKIKLFDIRQMVKKVNQETEPVFQVKTSKDISDDKIKQLISSKYDVNFNKIKLHRVDFFGEEAKAKNTNVMVTKDGFVTNDSVMISFDRAIKEGYLSRKDSLAFIMQIRADSLLFVEQRKADSILFVKQKEFEGRYNFNITGLGWINCDKFLKGTQPAVEFSINVGADMQQAMSNYNLVFTNIKSVMKGRYENGLVSFGKLPEGEDVKLVCVFEHNNKATACVQSFKISRGVIASLKFEEVTAETFRQKIEKL